ncbi:carboxylesterase/lipase family protein [Curtobacterium sp. 18060]|uniref:carboxylesterase/lipase family protein n=1 Tax=Curtobacterium sp. 18060 TaxID=2681408 RepID=UPI001356F964|nr:carboxylesterase family protein [Curtobacterium sp. 18060]
MTDNDAREVLVRTTTGVVRGARGDGISRFLGIPFAAPPFGANRFDAPQPVEPWDGVRDTLEAGPGAPQLLDPDDPLDNYFNPSTIGEDCLTLNVWSPEPGSAGLPVMVWIHGGGYVSGGSTAPAYDGSTFARDGVVYVSINYRLGIDGFAHFDGTTDNRGLRDQIAGLTWVRDNVAAFGGNPDDVTVFGESGGAVSVLTLMAMPAARGLFRRAIAESGSPRADASPDHAHAVMARTAELLGIEPTVDAFAALSLQETIAGVMPISRDWLDTARWGAHTFTISPFRAVTGTESLPDPVFASATRSTVPLLVGTVRNETISFVSALGLDTDAAVDRLADLLGADDSVIDAYRRGRRLTTSVALAEALWTDWAFRMPVLSLAEARRSASTFVSELHWETPLLPAGLGAGHGLDVPFVFDDLATARLLVGDDGPSGLAVNMHRAWVDFAKTGDPGWPEYTTDNRATKIFDTTSSVVSDLAAPERQAWAGRR